MYWKVQRSVDLTGQICKVISVLLSSSLPPLVAFSHNSEIVATVPGFTFEYCTDLYEEREFILQPFK